MIGFFIFGGNVESSGANELKLTAFDLPGCDGQVLI